MPLQFSIITVCKNPGEKLLETARSVFHQMEADFEFVVIDAASTDATPEWLEANTQSNLRWISEPDRGVYDAMNKGVSLAKGDFVLFLGAGDRLLPGVLAQAGEFIEKHPSNRPRFIYGDVLHLETGLPFIKGIFTKSRLARENICHQGIFYERSLFTIIGGYELTYPVMADWAFNLHCFGDSRIEKLFLPQNIAEFEAGGLCASVPDVPFAANRLSLITQHLGAYHGLRYRLAAAIERRLT